RFHFAKYALSSNVLPGIRETVSFAERARAYLMGISKKVGGGDPTRVSRIFSGKSPDGSPLKGHRHAFYLPLDEDRDGRIDHLLVHAAEPFGPEEIASLDRFRRIRRSKGRQDIDLILVSLSAASPGPAHRRWISATPFVSSRHHRKRRGRYEAWLAGELERECIFHHLPRPAK
ncbi:MAG: type I-U CRISPR-associated protein Cas5/Cas6, partial [Desulfobacterales bacterium]|nr:type I-U CRISPR-associated protein Cas5/Cas6 [Desulfobacterales bacterium]